MKHFLTAFFVLFLVFFSMAQNTNNVVGKWAIFEFKTGNGASHNYKTTKTVMPQSVLDKFKGEKDSSTTVDMLYSVLKGFEGFTWTFTNKGEYEEKFQKVRKGTYVISNQTLTTSRLNSMGNEIKNVYKFELSGKYLTLEEAERQGEPMKFIFEKIE
jgi:hypothetical protein